MASSFLHAFPALKSSVLLAAGILAGGLFSDHLLAIASVSATLLAVRLILIFRRVEVSARGFLSASFLLVSMGSTGAVLKVREAVTIPDSLVGKKVILLGELLESPRPGMKQVRFRVQGAAILEGKSNRSFSTPVLVSMRRKMNPGYLQYGMTIAMRGSLSRPPEERNPGEFDQRAYYTANGILWTFLVDENGICVVDSNGGSWVMREVVMPARAFTIGVIDSLIGGEEGEFLKGIMIGEREGLSFRLKNSFTVAGVAHVLAVSGGNVAVIAAFVFYVLEILRVPARLRLLVACLGVIFYMLLVGDQPPVVRATIMALVLLVGKLFDERPNPLNALGVSALIILGMDARQLFDVGFQLSFMAVLSIVHMYPIVNQWITEAFQAGTWQRFVAPLLRVCAVSFVATLGTLPLTAVYFGQVSVIGLLANIAVVPASGLSLTLGLISVPIFLVSPFVAGTFAALNQLVLDLTIRITTFAAALPFASVDTLRFTTADSLPYYACLLLLFHLSKGVITRRIAIVLLAAMVVWIFLPIPSRYSNTGGKLRVSFIDVGQGDAALVEFPNSSAMLIDTGPLSASFDAGERIVVPFLKRRGISVLHWVVITHPHSDHMGGLPAVLQEFPVREVLHCGREVDSELFTECNQAIEDEQSLDHFVGSGSCVNASPDTRVYVLSPPNDTSGVMEEEHPPGINNSSIVLRILYGDVAILLTGDAEEEAESCMIAVYGDFLNAALLKAGHHGSRTSSSEEFVSVVQPRYAVISVGKENRYGHPSLATIECFEKQGTQVLRTDEEGAVVFESDGNNLWRVDWRED